MQQRRSDEGRQCGTLGVGLRTRVKKLGVKKSKKEEVQSEILAHKEEQGLPKELHEGGGQEVVMSGFGVSKNLGCTCSGRCLPQKDKIEEVDGSSSGKKKVQPRCPCSGKPKALKWNNSSLLWLLRLGQKGRGLANGTQNKKKHG